MKRLSPVDIQISSGSPGQPGRRLRLARPLAFRLQRRQQTGQQQLEPECILCAQPAVNLVHLLQYRLQCLYINRGEFGQVQALLRRRLLILHRSLSQQ